MTWKHISALKSVETPTPNKMEQLYSGKDFRISCSSIGKLLTGTTGKSKAQKIREHEAVLIIENGKLQTLTVGSKSHTNKLDKIAKVQSELDEFKKLPDVPPLSKTAITHLEEWCKQRIYGHKKDFVSKQTYKGNSQEKEAIEYASVYLWKIFEAQKNTERFYTEYIEGEPDIITAKTVEDIKNSFTYKTFPLFAKALPNADYYWQLLGYIIILRANGFNIESAGVNYTLMPMPDELLDSEAFYIAKLTHDEDTISFQDKKANILENLRHENALIEATDIKYRAKRFEVLYNEDDANLIVAMVKQAREYIDNYLIV